MKKPKRIDGKYWVGTRDFNHFAYEEDLENYIQYLEEEAEESLRFIDFENQTPNYGDQILLQYPPESGRDPIVTVYDRYTDWLFGCRYAIINEKQK